MDILIKHISYIDKVRIHDSEKIIYYLKYLLSGIVVFSNKKTVIDCSVGCEFIIAKLSNSDWRIDSLINSDYFFRLKNQWNLTDLSNGLMEKFDIQLSLGIYNSILTKQQIKKWKSFNYDILRTYGKLMSIANRVITDGTQLDFCGIVFDYSHGVLSIVLPTKRIIRFRVKLYKHNIISADTDKPITGDHIFKTIVLALQRDYLTYILHDLIEKRYNVVYHTNTQICLDDARVLPSYLLSEPLLRIN